jgi:hypothetical protein
VNDHVHVNVIVAVHVNVNAHVIVAVHVNVNAPLIVAGDVPATCRRRAGNGTDLRRRHDRGRAGEWSVCRVPCAVVRGPWVADLTGDPVDGP